MGYVFPFDLIAHIVHDFQLINHHFYKHTDILKEYLSGFGIGITLWDFLPKFLSLHYYTTLEGVLGIQRSGQVQETIICLFVPLFFSPNSMTFKKPKKISKSSEKLLFFGIFSEFVQFWLENSSSNQLDELKWIILLLLTPKSSIEVE